jgi:hypothetical protein
VFSRWVFNKEMSNDETERAESLTKDLIRSNKRIIYTIDEDDGDAELKQEEPEIYENL